MSLIMSRILEGGGMGRVCWARCSVRLPNEMRVCVQMNVRVTFPLFPLTVDKDYTVFVQC